MWSYYGAKTNVVDYYPQPVYGTIIEPFAGSARYALKYFDRNIIISDKYPVIINIWKWLQKCSPKDILSLPDMKTGQKISDYKFDCQEASDLMGFLIGFTPESPRKTVTSRMEQRPNRLNHNLKQIANNLFKIKHWDIRCGDYTELDNIEATWFIDPPYEFGGHSYKFNNKKLDFKFLAQWCMDRKGQTMVCETTQATWMAFKPMISHHTRNRMQKEAIWTNFKSDFDHQQTEMFNSLIQEKC